MCLGICILYWVVMFELLPYLWGYKLTSKEIELSDGLVVKKWIKVYGDISVDLDFID